MMIGPERKRAEKRDRPKKAKKRAAKEAAAREAAARGEEASSVTGPPSTTGARTDEAVPPSPSGHDGLAPSAGPGTGSAVPEPNSLAGSAAATGNPGSVTSAAASATTDGLMAVAEPEPTEDPIAVLLAGIDRARERVDGLLELAQALTDPTAGDALPVGRGLGLQLVPDPAPVAEVEAPATPVAEATGAAPPAVSAPVVAPPTASARLVARELLGRGMDAEGVRTRLRDGYGVPDPDAVLAALA